ncbi:uncharacterized protein LOC124454136 [Xenia sp. Carnegie-2017]|uniref:uncharacterized protein LOC124454136 n=1 Tax=Xenia sp. Carnegie-2017 TaxID=2897299 RepID=UPI001F03D7A6|nr:uncharacterized protein LOC124454136 [Xenia sp. Carnegie-2017]
MYGQLHYRWLEMDKSDALNLNRGNFYKTMTLSSEAIHDLRWWQSSICTTYRQITHNEPSKCLTTDASLTGWAAPKWCMCWGNWTPLEASNHINYLEILAVLFALESFSSELKGQHVKVLIDNTTAVACINQMGTCHSRSIHKLTCNIWTCCISYDIWLTAAHIPGLQNVTADRESRISRRETEWQLNKTLFTCAIQKLDVTPNIDLFASRLNHQVKPYVSYQPDPYAIAVNAFTISWANYTFYAFPPFSIVSQVLQKIVQEKSTGLVLVPNWPTQSWWPALMQMLIAHPVVLSRGRMTLTLPAHPDQIHPLHTKLELLLCHLSGNSSLIEAFHQRLLKSSSSPGGPVPRSNILHTLTVGDNIAMQTISILSRPL